MSLFNVGAYEGHYKISCLEQPHTREQTLKVTFPLPFIFPVAPSPPSLDFTPWNFTDSSFVL